VDAQSRYGRYRRMGDIQDDMVEQIPRIQFPCENRQMDLKTL